MHRNFLANFGADCSSEKNLVTPRMKEEFEDQQMNRLVWNEPDLICVKGEENARRKCAKRNYKLESLCCGGEKGMTQFQLIHRDVQISEERSEERE